jgi:TRAP-type C4-dicarboxylate transport system permease small subunit
MRSYSSLTKTIAETIAVVLFLTVLILQTANIFFRYTQVRPPWMWVQDFTKYSLIWMVFLLWHLADRDQAHFAVDVAVTRSRGRVRKALQLLAHVAAMIFAAVTVWSSVAFIPTTMSYSTQSFSSVPMGVVYMVIPLGLALVFVERLRLFLQVLKD